MKESAASFACLGLGFPSCSLWGSGTPSSLSALNCQTPPGAVQQAGGLPGLAEGLRPDARKVPGAPPAQRPRPSRPSLCAHRTGLQGVRFRRGRRRRRLNWRGRGPFGGHCHGAQLHAHCGRRPRCYRPAAPLGRAAPGPRGRGAKRGGLAGAPRAGGNARENRETVKCAGSVSQSEKRQSLHLPGERLASHSGPFSLGLVSEGVRAGGRSR